MVFVFITDILSSVLLLVHLMLQLLQSPVEPKEIEIQAKPDGDCNDQYDIQLVLSEKIHSYPFG
jgi:hypothetical protein